MAWRLLSRRKTFPSFPCSSQSPNPNYCLQTIISFFPRQTPLISIFSSPFSSSYDLPITCRLRKKLKKKAQSPRVKLVQPQSHIVQHFERIVGRDSYFRFLTRAKSFLSKQPDQIIRLDEAGKLHRELGFPRGRKVARSIEKHPSLFQIYRHTDDKLWIGFTELMEKLIEEERAVMDSMEEARVSTVRKLVMMSAKKRVPVAKIYHCRELFGIPEDFRDRIKNYPEYFNVVIDTDGRPVIELVCWDPSLAVSAIEKDFVTNEDNVKRAFKFPVRKGRSLNLNAEEEKMMNLLNTLPLVSPYSDGSDLKPWSLEAEKYRVGVLHELLSLTLEKRASIHHIVEFKEEFSLTKHTYHLLLKQPRTFYLAGTEMNWTVFLRDSYGEDGILIEKDPQVAFNEKLYRYATGKLKEEMRNFEI